MEKILGEEVADNFATCPLIMVWFACQHRVVLPTGTSLPHIGRSQSKLAIWLVASEMVQLPPPPPHLQSLCHVAKIWSMYVSLIVSCLLKTSAIQRWVSLMTTVIKGSVQGTVYPLKQVSNWGKQLINIPLERLRSRGFPHRIRTHRSGKASDRKYKD